jgi:subtilisin family serine protease
MVVFTPEPLTRPKPRCDVLDGAIGEGVRVAIVDSGWDYSIEIPGVRLERGVSFADTGDRSDRGRAEDVVGHGTACLTTLSQVAPGAVLCPVRVFHRQLFTSRQAITSALDWTIDQGFDVISLSLATDVGTGAHDLYRVCAKAHSMGVVIVAAALQERSDRLPAAFDNVLSVGCSAYAGPFDLECCPHERIDCRVAPGINGRVVGLAGELLPAQNASFAAPVIAGIVALLKSRFGPISLHGVLSLLKSLALPCTRCSRVHARGRFATTTEVPQTLPVSDTAFAPRQAEYWQ